jgi:hypothetical protein
VKCIRVSGYALPRNHRARIDLQLEFRPKNTDGWPLNSQTTFRAGFVFKSTTSATFGSVVRSSTSTIGLVGAGQKMTAVGGFVMKPSAPASGYIVRLFNSQVLAQPCSSNTNVVGQDTTTTDGFWFVWNTGSNQTTGTNTLPSNVAYYVQVCNGPTQVGSATLKNKLGNKEFDEEDFIVP